MLMLAKSFEEIFSRQSHNAKMQKKNKNNHKLKSKQSNKLEKKDTKNCCWQTKFFKNISLF